MNPMWTEAVLLHFVYINLKQQNLSVCGRDGTSEGVINWQITLIVPYIKTRLIYTCVVGTWPTCTCCSREELQCSNIFLFYEFLPVRRVYSCIKRNGAMQVHILLYLHKPKTMYCNVDLYSFEITRIHLQRPPAFVHVHLCTVSDNGTCFIYESLPGMYRTHLLLGTYLHSKKMNT